MPAPPLPWSTAPVVSVPIRLSSTALAPVDCTTTPSPSNLLIARPWSSPGAPEKVSPSTPAPALVPSISTWTRAVVEPSEDGAWLCPSIITPPVTSGRADPGWMVWGVVPAISNSIIPPDAELTCWMAARRVQTPFPSSHTPSLVSLSLLSPVESTVMVTAASCPVAATAAKASARPAPKTLSKPVSPRSKAVSTIRSETRCAAAWR